MRNRIRPISAVATPAAPRFARPMPRVRAMRGNPKGGTSSWFGILLFMALMAMFIPPDLSNPFGDLKTFGTPNETLRIIKLLFLAFSIIMVARRWWQTQALFKTLNPWFTAMMVLIPASTLWSIDVGATQARFVSFLSMVAVCFAIGLLGWHRQRFQQIVRPTVTLFLAASFIVGMIWPELVLEQGLDDASLRNSWHGLVAQKNEFGQIGSFGVILWAHAWLSRESRWYAAAAGLALSATCLWLSRSSTSILATGLAVPILFLLQRPPPGLRPYMPYIVGIFTGLVLTYGIAILNIIPGLGILLKPFVAMTGKDFTFSNRVLIWQIIQEHIRLAPVLGTGYGAYWVGPIPSSPSAVFLTRIYVYPTQSHNGFLEIVNDLGFVGLFILLGYLITHVKQCLALLKVDRILPPLLLAILFQQIIINLSEACWVTAKNASSLIMTFSTIAVACALVEHRRKTPLQAPSTARSVPGRRAKTPTLARSRP